MTTLTFFKARKVSDIDARSAMAELYHSENIVCGNMVVKYRWNNGYVNIGIYTVTTMHALRCCHVEHADYSTVDVYRIPKNVGYTLGIDHKYLIVEKGFGNTKSYLSDVFPAIIAEITSKRIKRMASRKSDTKGVRPMALRLIAYAHDARMAGEKAMARHWLGLHNHYRAHYAQERLWDGLV